jgi:hypothetical protein
MIVRATRCMCRFPDPEPFACAGQNRTSYVGSWVAGSGGSHTWDGPECGPVLAAIVSMEKMRCAWSGRDVGAKIIFSVLWLSLCVYNVRTRSSEPLCTRGYAWSVW